MSVCLVNLALLDPESNGGLSRVAREISRLLVDFTREQPAFHPVFAVQTRFVPHFAKWLERSPAIIPIDPQQPAVLQCNPKFNH